MSVEPLPELSSEDRLDVAVAEYLESVERGEFPTPERWLQRYPDLAPELTTFFADESRFDRLVAPLRNVSAPCSITPPMGGSNPTANRTIQDYELLEEMGRGGMGVIYKAHQRSLNRLVAIKMIRSGEWATPQERLRFRWEAETIAALDHPNIVPIFEIGETTSADGTQLPFFSMKLIDGKNLAQAREQFRNNWMSIAHLMRLMTRAVEHAHQRGILHRDLKPANILLGAREESIAQESGSGFRFGSSFIIPHITDFGLARRTQQLGGQTLPGTIVGTPAYLAPEVARGHEFATITSDVYSLGAILYELLTGVPPFQADTPIETIRLVSDTSIRLPRKINSTIPVDLETICLKCLETDAARRYPSAAKLAEDLEQFIAGRPISARPIGSLKRFGRWCRRQPVIAGLCAALLLVMAISLPLIIVSWRHALNQEQLAETRLGETQTERDHADAGFGLAFNTLGDLFKLLANEPGKESPESEQVKKQLLQNGLKYYREFVEHRGNDPKLRRELAQAFFQIALISSKIGTKRETAESSRNAVNLLRQLTAADPDDKSLVELLASSLTVLGNALNALNQLDEAILVHEEAAEVWKRVQKNRVEGVLTSLTGREQAIALMNRGVVLQGKEDWQAALTSFQQAKKLLVEVSPKATMAKDNRIYMIRCLLNIAQAEDRLNRAQDAFQHAIEAAGLAEQMNNGSLGSKETKFLFAMTCKAVGGLQRKLGDSQAGKLQLQLARKLLEELHRENPRVTEYAWNLALVYEDFGAAERKANTAEALKTVEQAELLLRELVERDDESHPNRSSLARIERLRANIYQDQGNPTGACKAFEQAKIQLEYLLAHDSNISTLRWNLAQVCHQLGFNLGKLKKFSEALTAYEEAAKHYSMLLEQSPADKQIRKNFSSALGNIARVQRDLRKFPEALVATEQRANLWPDHPDELYDAATDFGAPSSWHPE